MSSSQHPAPTAGSDAPGSPDGVSDPAAVRRSVSSRITGRLHGNAEVVLSVAVAEGVHRVSEQLTLHVDGAPVEVSEVAGPHGTRLHRATGVPEGAVSIEYAATVAGTAADAPVDELDLITYLRPSRYAANDRLFQVALAEFGGTTGAALVHAVGEWVHQRIAYISGSSRPTDGAVDTYLARAGVCRDFAHLVITLLRARDIPARLVSVYAPGLRPMDFHAVVEAWVDGAWHAVDATRLAPRASLVRIATGRDAADTAFMTVQEGDFRLERLTVTAVAEPDLPGDDPGRLVTLS